MISQGSTSRARRPINPRVGQLAEPDCLNQFYCGFDSHHADHFTTRRDFEPYDPPKLREGVCKMCGEKKLIREDIPLCEECWEYNKDL